MIETANATVFPDPVFAFPMQSLSGGIGEQCARDELIALPALRGGMLAACTSVGVRMGIAANAETIRVETPRSVKYCTLLLKGARMSC